MPQNLKLKLARSRCGKGGTVYLGKKLRRWSLKFYSKYDEHTSGKKGHQMADEFVKAGLLDWSKINYALN
ncbi:hypothetical protein EH61_25935 [Escherichia coli]|nr:hypothetical protein EH61_25935 [Escherichia coli]